MNGDKAHEIAGRESEPISVSDFSSEELLEELARRLRTVSEELELLRVKQIATSEKSSDQSSERHLPETAEGLLAVINVDRHLGEDSSGWYSENPNTPVKLLRKKAIVRLSRMWTRMALDPSRLRNGEINRRGLERETGVPRNTMRPYLDAGLELHKVGRLYLDDDPSDVDIRIVDNSMDNGERGRARESKLKNQ